METETDQALKYCATKIQRLTLWKLKELAFDKNMTQKDLLREIVENYVKENYRPEDVTTV